MWEKVLFDIETDGLLDTCTRIWIIYATDLNTGESREWLEGDLSWIEFFNNTKHVVGHFIRSFDLEVFKKLHNYRLPEHVKVTDTLILSQVLDYRRFGNDGHSLERWGQFLGQPKQEHEDWTQFSEEMRTRCRSDVSLNIEVYKVLKEELSMLSRRSPVINTYLEAEHYLAEWCGVAEREGWPFDVEKGKKLKSELEASMQLAYDALSKKLGMKAVAVDKEKGIVETKRPKWIKNGFYDAHTANWFNIHPASGFEGEERMIAGEYCRVKFEPLSLDSVADVKIFLFRHNWQPLEWNSKYDETTRKKVRTSPKITEESLEFLGGDGKLYADFAVSRSRLGILNTWLESVDNNGMLHGKCIVIGTPSMRATHSIIVNVPSVDKPWGKEMRELFTHRPGWKLIGCDSSGNQVRGLAHFLKNKEYTEILLKGDIHQFNADKLTAVLSTIGVSHTVPRSPAKRVLYAFLFGAGGDKLWSYVFGVFNDKLGKKLKSGFAKAVPGFSDLLDKLERIFGNTSKDGYGYINSLVGNRIYVDSFHKLLVYLLQSTEKATCAAAVMLTMKGLKQANIPYIPHVFMHDEIQFEVPEEFAQQAGEIGKLSFKEGPKLVGVNIMDGEFKIGDNWYDTH